MPELLHALTSASGSRLPLIVLLVVLPLLPLLPESVRTRLRSVLTLGTLWAVARVLRLVVHADGPGRDVLLVVEFALGALTLTRGAFVLLVDVVVERSGARPMNLLLRGVLQGVLFAAVVGTSGSLLGVNPTSMVATGTLVTVVLGLSLQETFGQVASGLAIQMEGGVEVGDWVRLEKGDVGRVVATGWRSVIIQTNDRAQITVPNAMFGRSAYTNHSRPGRHIRRTLHVTLPYEIAPDRARAALLDACADVADVLERPEPSVLPWDFTDRGVSYWLRFYIADFGLRDRVQAEVVERVWYRLQRDGIPLALPTTQMRAASASALAGYRDTHEVPRQPLAAIEAFDFLSMLPAEAKERLAKGVRRLLFAAGDSIYRPGDDDRAAYVLVRGSALVASGARAITRISPGDVFGELGLLTNLRRQLSLKAVTPCEVHVLRQATFAEVVADHRGLVDAIAHVVATRRLTREARRAGTGVPSSAEVSALAEKIARHMRRVLDASGASGRSRAPDASTHP